MSVFFTYFQPSKRATRNHALFRSVSNERRMRFFFAGVSGSSCIFTLVLFVEMPLFELWCFTDIPAFAHWCFADSPTGLYQSCLIVHFVAPRILLHHVKYLRNLRVQRAQQQNASSAFVTGYFFWQFACWASWKLTGFFFLVFNFFELSLLLLDTIS